MASVSQVISNIQREGQSLVLRRVITGVAPVSVDLKGVVKDYKPNELVNGVQQGDRMVIICNAEIESESWPGPPRKGDQVVIDGKTATVQYCNTLRLRGQVARHNLQVRG